MKDSEKGYGFKKSLEQLQNFRDYINSRGVLTTNTRIDRYINYLTDYLSENNNGDGSKTFKSSHDGRFKSEPDWLLHVIREVHELEWIWKGLQVSPPRGIDEKLKIIISGHDFAAFDSNTRARDTQFELRIASYFCQIGLDVILYETDVIALLGDFAYFWECKRIANRKQLEKRLSAATRQLQLRMPAFYEGRRTIGCVAADITKSSFPRNGLNVAPMGPHSKKILQDKLLGVIRSLDKSKLFSEEGVPPTFYWIQIHFPFLIILEHKYLTRFSSYMLSRENFTDAEELAMAAFQGMQNFLTRIDASPISDEEQEKPKFPIDLTIPKGTTFGLAEGLYEEIRRTERLPERQAIAALGHITIKGTTIDFIFKDLDLIAQEKLADYIKKIAMGDPEGIWLMLFEIFIQKIFHGDPR